MWLSDVVLGNLWCLEECAVKAMANELCKIIVLKMMRPRLFWNADVWNFFFAVLFSLHRRVKQYCFVGQTILFHDSNTCVWQLKQYCFAREKEVFEVNKYETNRRCRSFLLIGFSFCPLEGGVFQKYALAENDESGNCVRETACLPLRLSMGEERGCCLFCPDGGCRVCADTQNEFYY